MEVVRVVLYHQELENLMRDTAAQERKAMDRPHLLQIEPLPKGKRRFVGNVTIVRVEWTPEAGHTIFARGFEEDDMTTEVYMIIRAGRCDHNVFAVLTDSYTDAVTAERILVEVGTFRAVHPAA